jgi:hypothetical protein
MLIVVRRRFVRRAPHGLPEPGQAGASSQPDVMNLHDAAVAGCHTRSEPAMPVAIATRVEGNAAMTVRTFEGRLRHAVDGICNRGNLDLADGVLAADYVNHGGLIPDLVRGPEAVKIAAVVAHLAFPGLRVTVEDLVADGERVAVRWTARGLPDAADALAGVTFGRLVGGRITESWTYWDGTDEAGWRRVALDRLRQGGGRPMGRRTRVSGVRRNGTASRSSEL